MLIVADLKRAGLHGHRFLPVIGLLNELEANLRAVVLEHWVPVPIPRPIGWGRMAHAHVGNHPEQLS